MNDKPYKEIESEAYINEKLIRRIDFIDSNALLHDEAIEVQEERHISELYRITKNMDKRELMTICSFAVRKHPFAYLQVLAEYLIEILSERKRRV